MVRAIDRRSIPSLGDRRAGVVNRDHLAAHLQNQLAPYVEVNKWLTQPALVEVHFDTWDFGFGVVGRHYDWGSHGMPDNLKIVSRVVS